MLVNSLKSITKNQLSTEKNYKRELNNSLRSQPSKVKVREKIYFLKIRKIHKYIYFIFIYNNIYITKNILVNPFKNTNINKFLSHLVVTSMFSKFLFILHQLLFHTFGERQEFHAPALNTHHQTQHTTRHKIRCYQDMDF